MGDEELEHSSVMKNELCSSSSSIFQILRMITIEPCIFIFFFAMSMENLLCSEIVIQKTCLIYLNYSAELCNNITSYKDEEMKVEKSANLFLMYSNLIQSLPSILFVLFVGPWSDEHGRKMPIILPFCGKAIYALIMWLYTVFWLIPTEYVMISSIPIALTGGLSCLMMAVYSYISDISEPEDRTIRIVILDICLILGPCIGLLLSNVTRLYLGYSGTYVITGILYLLCVVYIYFGMKETRGPQIVPVDDQELTPSLGSCYGIGLFDVANVVDTFKRTFERRPNRGRGKVVCLIASLCLMVFVFSSMSTEYLYTKIKFEWLYEQFVYWTVSAISLQAFGMLILFPLLSRVFKVRDDYLAIWGCLSVISAFLVQAFASSGYQMYIGSAIGCLGGLPLAVGRSSLSKLVPVSATGKLFSVVAALESLMPLLSSPLYAVTYNVTLDSFPGAFFIISAGLYLLAGVGFALVLSWSRRRDPDSTASSLIASEETTDDD